MKWPEPPVVWQAIEAYIRIAYDGSPPSAVRSRLETLRALDPQSFYDAAVFERKGDGPHAKLLLRLGNRFYPHMKLAIEKRPEPATLRPRRAATATLLVDCATCLSIDLNYGQYVGSLPRLQAKLRRRRSCGRASARGDGARLRVLRGSA